MIETVKKIISNLPDSDYDPCLERIVFFVEDNKEITRQDVINFVKGEIDYTEHDCKDEELREYICNAFRIFLCRF